MAPHAGTAGLKVLLAGTSHDDLNEAQQFLTSEGAIVTTSFAKQDLARLLVGEEFDVAVVEVEAEGRTVSCSNSLHFLTTTSLPVVVALDFQDAASMVKAVELGAVDILQKPVSSQTGRLGTLWQHTLRKRTAAAATTGGSESINVSSGAGSTAADPTVCTAGDDLVKAILPDLFEVDLWDEQNTTGTSGEQGSSVDTPETPDISHHLHQDYTSSHSLLSCQQNDYSSVHSRCSPSHEHMVKAHSVSSALSPVLVPQVVSTECEISSFDLQPTFSECLEYVDGDPCEDSRQSKKQKVEWTRELHDKFVGAVEALSVDKAVPSKILERMGSCSEGLTRQNIASHLQKYRNRKRSRQSHNYGAPLRSMGTSYLPPLLPAPTMTPWSAPQPACWPPYTPQATSQCAAPYNWSQAPLAPVTPNIALTISEMLTQPQGPPPLGLKLDTAAVLAQMSNTRLIQA